MKLLIERKDIGNIYRRYRNSEIHIARNKITVDVHRVS